MNSAGAPEPQGVGERRRRFLTRAIPLVVLALVAFVGGMVVAAGPEAPAAGRFLEAWQRADYERMHAQLTPEARKQYPPAALERSYSQAARTVTADGPPQIGEPRQEGDEALAEVSFDTHIFGEIGGELRLPLSGGRIAWAPNLVFPGLAAEERLGRRTRAPPRAAILAADRTPLAKGPAATRFIESSATAVVGELSTPSLALARELEQRGFPPGTVTGTAGLELAYDERLAGRPGGQLLAVPAGAEDGLAGRTLATTEPVRGEPVRTTIDPELQAAAVTALGGLYGGVAVLDARKGRVLALAGIAYSAPQPPGSTFKLITATGALEDGIVSLDEEFPVEVSNSLIGREIANSNDSPCGGTFAESFANSCNTVFAPLGAELGGERLVETAELYGFNAPPPLFDPAATAAAAPPQSTIPAEISTSVEVGESAIGQGRVLATPLQMASVAQTIANRGVRLPTPIARTPGLEPDAEPVEVASKRIAATLRDLMIKVVADGTGVAAALPGVQVAGKTGTAELGPAPLEPGQELGPGEDPPQELDAWFTSFAPANDPRLAVAVMIVNSEGDGGVVAAPIARQVLAAGLGIE